jgi:hypothetical protein
MHADLGPVADFANLEVVALCCLYGSADYLHHIRGISTYWTEQDKAPPHLRLSMALVDGVLVANKIANAFVPSHFPHSIVRAA